MSYNHPATFINIYEVQRNGDSITIHSAKSAQKGLNQRSANYEADIDNDIVIEFDLAWLFEHRDNVDLSVSVRANLNGKPIEVPSYMRVGESARLGRFSDQALGIIGALFDLNKELYNLNRRIGYIYYDLSSKEYTDTQTESELESVFEAFIRDTKKDELLNLVQYCESKNDEVKKFLMNWKDFGKGLDILADPEFGWFMSVFKDVCQNHPALIENSANLIRNDLVPSLQQITYDPSYESDTLMRVIDALDTANYFDFGKRYVDRFTEQRNLVTAMQASLRNLLNKYKNWTYLCLDETSCKANDYRKASELKEVVDSLTIGMIKNTKLILSSTLAKPGDTLYIEIINGSEDLDLSYVFPVQIAIRDFGWKNGLTDSFLFFKRLRVKAPTVANQAVTATEDPIPVNYEPYAGLSFIWTNNARDRIVRALGLGVGFNVSFPRFGTQISSFDANSGGGSLTTTSTEDELGMSVGPVVSLFDGALQVSYGVMLSNVEKKRQYWAIGFSFLKGAKGVESVVK